MRPGYAALFAAGLILFAGCLAPPQNQPPVEENGLQITEFSASQESLRAGQSTQFLLKLNNTNLESARDIFVTLSNTNPLRFEDTVETSHGTKNTCEFPALSGVDTRQGLSTASCIWTAHAPEDVSTTITTPVTATVLYTGSLHAGAVSIAFQEDTADTPVPAEKQTLSASNGEAAFALTAPHALPTNTEFTELTVSLRNAGDGDFQRDENGDARVAVNFSGALTHLLTGDTCRNEDGYVLLRGNQETYHCTLTLDASQVQSDTRYDLVTDLGYSYVKTVGLK